jgi:hypothetical protein
VTITNAPRRGDKAPRVFGLIGAGAVVGLIALTASIMGAVPQATVAHADTGSGTVAFTPGFDKTPDEALCKDNHYIDSSSRTVQAGDVEHRQFATAVSIPFKGTTDVAVVTETSAEICGNPTELGMVVDDMMLWTGFAGAEENKAWVGKIQADLKKQGLDAFSGKNVAGDKIVSPEFQKYAGWINAVLLRFNTDGKQSLTSVRNWEVPAMADPKTQPVAVQAADPESKPSWVRTLRNKIGTCLYKIGFNAEDKRIETFNCVTPKPPTTTTTTPNCKTTNSCTTTHTPTCEEKGNCTTTCEQRGNCPTTCTSCLAPKTGHVPSAGNDPGTRDDGTGQEPPAPAPSGPATAPVPVNTGGNGPVDTGTTLPNQSGNGSTPTPPPVNNGSVGD